MGEREDGQVSTSCVSFAIKRWVAASNLAMTSCSLLAFLFAFASGELRPLHQLVPASGGPRLFFAHTLFYVWSLFSFTELIPIYAESRGTRLGAGFHTIHHVLRAIALWTLSTAAYCSVQSELSCAAFCVHQSCMKLTYELGIVPKHIAYQNVLYLLYGSLAPHRAVCYIAGYLHGTLGLAIVPLLAMEAIVTFGFLTGYPSFVSEQLLPYLRGERPGIEERAGEVEAAPLLAVAESREAGAEAA
jgi:hypothetical protein